jgi:ribosomal protein L12E/L44/L45/RPP1/RPP2
MPLFPGIGKVIREHNISEMIKAGHKPEQAVAAAYAKEKESRRRKARSERRIKA